MPIQINDMDGLTQSAFERAKGDLAIGYVRISDKKPIKIKQDDKNFQFKHNFNNRIEYNQYNAIRYYCHARQILCLGWFIERQSSSGTDDQEPFCELRELIKVCLKRNITLAEGREGGSIPPSTKLGRRRLFLKRMVHDWLDDLFNKCTNDNTPLNQKKESSRVCGGAILVH